MSSQNTPKQTRHSLVYHDDFGEDVDRAVVVRAAEYPPGYTTNDHWHRRGQLVYASTGVITVTTEKGAWVVPSQRAVWIPSSIVHDFHTAGWLSMRSVYIRQEEFPWLPANCCVVAVTPLLKELILRAIDLPKWYELDGHQERIMTLILDEIRELPIMPLHLPEPNDSRLKEIASRLKHDPADRRTLVDWGKVVGASSRTLARLFLTETGMTFRHWQRQVRLLNGLARLAEKQPVTEVALELGYETPSAFIAMFRRALGVTPGQYFSNQGRAAGMASGSYRGGYHAAGMVPSDGVVASTPPTGTRTSRSPAIK